MRTQPCLDSAAAERATAQAARAIGDDVVALEAALQGRNALRQAYSAAQNSAAGELRAFFCSSPYGVPGQSWDTTIQQLAQSGFNAVAVCLADGGGAYYDTNVQAFSDGTLFPRVYDSRGDQLALLVAATQKYGVDLYVWKVNWAMRYWVTPSWFSDRMRSEGRLQLDFNGGELFSGDRWLDPAVPANQDLDVATMVELASTPGVKGILLDYIRYPQNGSFSPASNAAFQAYLRGNSLIGPTDTVVFPAAGTWISRFTFKVDHDGARTNFLDDGTTYVYDAWLAWRQSNITADVARISAEARAANPNILITAAVVFNWAIQGNLLGQDWVSWLTSNYIDSAVPMDYTSYNAQLDNYITSQQGWASGKTIYPAIDGSINPGDLLVNPSDRIVDQILLTRQHNTGGFYVFNLSTTEATSILPTLGLGTTRVDSPPTLVTPAGAAPNPVTGATTLLATLGADVDTGETSLTYTWSTTGTPPASVAFSANGDNAAKSTTATFTKAGTYDFLVTIADPGGLSTTSSVSVTVSQTLTSVTVSPAAVNLYAGHTQQFTAVGRDQFGDALAVQPSFTWSATTGGITSGGLYTAPVTDATATVTAASAGVNGTATANVTGLPQIVSWQSARNHGTMTDVALTIADDGKFSEGRNGGVRRLLVTFDHAVAPASFTSSSVLLAGRNVAGSLLDLSGISIGVSLTSGDMVGIIDFSQALPDCARYLVRLQGVTDAAGNALYGDADRVFTNLKGDANGDLRTNVTDLSYIQGNRATPINRLIVKQVRADVSVDKNANATDLSVSWANRGKDARYIADPTLGGQSPQSAFTILIDDARSVPAPTVNSGNAALSLSATSPAASNKPSTQALAAPAAAPPPVVPTSSTTTSKSATAAKISTSVRSNDFLRSVDAALIDAAFAKADAASADFTGIP